MKKINFINGQEPALNDANLNQLQNNIEEAILEANTYSEEEQVVGTWIDGKPIYRKVVEYTTNDTIGEIGARTSIDIPHDISNFNEIIFCFARRGAILLPQPSGWSTSDKDTFVFEVNATNIRITIINDTCGADVTFTFILEYTKTTD